MSIYQPNIQNKHFLLTHALTILTGSLITLGLTYENKLYDLFLMCLPIFILYIIFEYFLVWKKQQEQSKKFQCINALMLIIAMPIFFALYFIFYYESTSYQFQKVDNCQIIGKASSNIEGNEQYSILYVDFEYQGQKLLGYACSSNQNQGNIYETIRPGIFYNYGDAIYQIYYNIRCNKNKNQTEYIKNSLGQDDQNQEKNSKQIKVQQVYSQIYTNGECSVPYSFSKVKLPSWYCLEKNFDLQKYMEPQSCYMNLYKNEDFALKNGIDRSNLRSSDDFAAISFQSPNYYPKLDLTLLILFVYYPFLISLNLIFNPLSRLIFYLKAEMFLCTSSLDMTLKSVRIQ